MCVYVHVCVCARVRACVCVYVCVCVRACLCLIILLLYYRAILHIRDRLMQEVLNKITVISFNIYST